MNIFLLILCLNAQKYMHKRCMH